MDIDSEKPSSSLQNSTCLTPQSNNNLSSSARNTNMLMTTAKRKNESNDEEFKFEVLTAQKILQNMDETIKEVNSVIELTPTVTRILLHHFRWDKEKLMERFYDGNQERLFKEAHIVNPFRSKLSRQTSTGTSSKHQRIKESECQICFLSCQEQDMASLECKHTFCKETEM